MRRDRLAVPDYEGWNVVAGVAEFDSNLLDELPGLLNGKGWSHAGNEAGIQYTYLCASNFLWRKVLVHLVILNPSGKVLFAVINLS